MNKYKIQILWVLGLLILASSWLVSYVQPDFIYDNLDVHTIEKEVQSIVDEAEAFELNALFELRNSNESSNFNVFDHNLPFDFVIQKQDSVLFWSTNKIEFKVLNAISSAGIYSLSSRIYLVWSRIIDEHKVSYLIPLKKDFEFENSFLQNLPFESVSFPKNYKPCQMETDAAIQVNLNNIQAEFYFKSIGEDEIFSYWKYIIALAFVFSMVLLIVQLYQALNRSSISYFWKSALWILSLFIVRFVFITESFTPFVQDFYLFQPFDFANSFIPSLGMLLVNAIWLYALLLFALRFWSKASPEFNFFQSVVAQLLSFALFLGVVYFIYDIILNSTSNFIDFNSVMLRYQDILLILVFGILVLLSEKVLLFIIQHSKAIENKHFVQYFLLVYLPFTVLLLLFDWRLMGLAVFMFISAWLLSLHTKPFVNRQTIRFTIIFLGSVFVISFIGIIASEKEQANKNLLLGNYQTENNRLAEFLLEDFEKKLVNDTALINLLYQIPETEDETDIYEDDIYNYISNQYVTGFWSQYNEEVTLCGSAKFFNIDDNVENNIESCSEFFESKVSSVSKKVGNTHFVTIQDYGIDFYLGKYKFLNDRDSSLIDLYIILKPKEQHKNLGYPSILLTKEVDNENEQKFYSFAKYVNGKLVNRTGVYNYPLEYEFKTEGTIPQEQEKNGYIHLIEQQSPGVYNVISSKEQSFWSFFIVLSYIFILYIASFYFVEFFSLLVRFKPLWKNTLKDKLRLSYMALLLITFFVIVLAVIFKSTEISELRNKHVLEEKMQSVLVELKHKLSQSGKLENLNMNYLLIKFSNVFFTDINLYNLSGELIASSRPEVFEKGLIGNRMNPGAFIQLSNQLKSKYIHQENIGKQRYLSAYMPFKNPQNESIAYLNLPYFAKDKEMKSDVTILVTSFLNIFVLLFLVTGLFTVFISNRITLPLAIIQQKLKDFSLKGKNESIVYQSKDEIGALVLEYNRTVEALNENIELLAQKEREGAWKEMAKQIAHEIKNPLTPMKLSIQHLKYIWKDDAPNKDEKLNATIDLIVRQIDNLAEIASAFADFSKMTVAQRTTFDVNDLIQDQIHLHSKAAHFDLINDTEEALVIFADEKQISRVFQNLLINAIQATEDDQNPQIKVILKNDETTVSVEICDNGKGMDAETQERLFEPNFTTKNSGMGLGLAIVKQIVDNNSGKIAFNSDLGKGSCFTVILPKGKDV